MRLVIAARKSDLARIQAQQVGNSLKNKFSDLEIEYHFRESLGDKNLNDPLWKMPERGVFTEDFHKGLVAGDFDLVVHSWKDLPVENRPETEIAATLPREDMRDLLLLKKSSLGKKDVTLLSSSPRRAYNLGNALPKLLPSPMTVSKFEPVRGNVQTRVKKLLEGEADGLIVAKAAFDRMLSTTADEFKESREFLRESLKKLNWMALPLSLNPTAAAQGALAIEIRAGREDIKKRLQAIHDEATFHAVQNERRELKKWGGGCHQKIGISILERSYGRVIFARGVRDSGEIIFLDLVEDSQEFKAGDYFPKDKTSRWFERQPMAYGDEYKNYRAHWVSKAEALPQDVQLPLDAVIWTGGLKTWETLASRGFWVNGSTESLGEQEPERLENLVGDLQWCKWTHKEGTSDRAHVMKTYELIPRATQPVLSEKIQHFYWMSGSSFKEALKSYKWLLNKTHWCGPGSTAETIASELKKHSASGALHIALNFEEWQKKMSK